MTCFAYNTSVHATTGYTPFLSYAYEERLPVDVVCGSAPHESVPHHDYVADMHQRIAAAFERVRERTGREQVRQRLHGAPFEVGDLVWLWHPAVPRKKDTVQPQGMAGSTRHSQAYIRQHVLHSEPQQQATMTSHSF